jgi:serine protease Do
METANQPQPEAGKITSGTGVILSTMGHVLTNNHMIDGCQRLIVQRNGELPVRAHVLFNDRTNDLALLKSELQTLADEVAPISVGRSVRGGEPIAVYGFPMAGTLSTTGNVVAGNITALTGLGDDARFFQISAPVQSGNSGGPLLDQYGNVVGIVNAKLDEIAWANKTGDLPQNVNFAIKASVFSTFLDAHSTQYLKAVSLAQLDLPSITERAQKFTAFILCMPE